MAKAKRKIVLNVEVVPIDDVLKDPVNARRHPTRNIEATKASLAKFGQQKPIVVSPDGVVLAGNGTLQAAVDLGWDEIAIVRSSLTGADAAAYSIADNRTAELAEWDFPNLSSLLQGLRDDNFPLDVLGWEDYELAPLLEAEWTPPPPGEIDTVGKNTHRSLMIVISSNYIDTVRAALEQVRKDHPDAKDGQAIAIICAAFLASNDAMAIAHDLPDTDDAAE